MKSKSVETIAYEIVQRQKLYMPDLGRLQNDIQAALDDERKRITALEAALRPFDAVGEFCRRSYNANPVASGGESDLNAC